MTTPHRIGSKVPRETYQNIPLLPWKPVRDLCFIRELPVEQPPGTLVLSGIDLNRSPDHTKTLEGIVEAVGPKVTLVRVGDKVVYDIGAGEFRVPGDDMVRIMYERDIAGVLDEGDMLLPCPVCGGEH